MEYVKTLLSKNKANTDRGKCHLFLKQGKRGGRRNHHASEKAFRTVQPSHISCNAVKINKNYYTMTC